MRSSAASLPNMPISVRNVSSARRSVTSSCQQIRRSSRYLTARRRSDNDREWDVYEPGPVILTTRTHWKEDSTPELNTLMTVRQQDVLQVRFRPESPQFSATIALDALDDPKTASGFLSTLRELAAGASAHRQ